LDSEILIASKGLKGLIYKIIELHSWEEFFFFVSKARLSSKVRHISGKLVSLSLA